MHWQLNHVSWSLLGRAWPTAPWRAASPKKTFPAARTMIFPQSAEGAPPLPACVSGPPAVVSAAAPLWLRRTVSPHAQRPQSAHQGLAMGQVREFLVGTASGGSPEQKSDSLDQTNTLSFYFILFLLIFTYLHLAMLDLSCST